jgi:hypothetical protein
MAHDLQPIDATNIPDLARLVHEVNQTGQAQLIRANGDTARLSPAQPRRRGRQPTKADIEASLAAAGSWQSLIDAEQLERDLDVSRGSGSSAVDPSRTGQLVSHPASIS